MIFTETLPPTDESQLEMKSACFEWKSYATSKYSNATQPESSLSLAYLTVCTVCKNSIYRFKTKYRAKYHVQIAFNSSLRLLGFALTKILELSHPRVNRERPLKLLYIHFLTKDPSTLDEAQKVVGIGKALLSYLKRQCVVNNLDGLFVDPVPSAVSFFTRCGFERTELKNGERDGMLLTKDAIRAKTVAKN